MARHLTRLVVAACLVSSCGRGADQRTCSGPNADVMAAAHPNFVVVLKLSNRPLPADTVVHVTYGGSGTEDYRLSGPSTAHEVIFCKLADANGVPLETSADASATEAGAPGSEPRVVESLYCALWTGGYAKLEVRASGLTDLSYPLAPQESGCTVSKTIVLDSPDGG